MWPLKVQRVLGGNEFEPSWNMRNSFDQKLGGIEEKTKLQLAKLILLVQIQLKGKDAKGECAYFQYMECTRPRSKVDKVEGCICLPCFTDDDIDHTTDE